MEPSGPLEQEDNKRRKSVTTVDTPLVAVIDNVLALI
jgi:hypothetical protein